MPRFTEENTRRFMQALAGPVRPAGGKAIVPADTDIWPAPQWARPRYFAGFTKRAIVGPATDAARFITFRCLFVPTRRTHGGAFGFCYGPYRTRAGARAAAEIHGLPVYDALAGR